MRDGGVERRGGRRSSHRSGGRRGGSSWALGFSGQQTEVLCLRGSVCSLQQPQPFLCMSPQGDQLLGSPRARTKQKDTKKHTERKLPGKTPKAQPFLPLSEDSMGSRFTTFHPPAIFSRKHISRSSWKSQNRSTAWTPGSRGPLTPFHVRVGPAPLSLLCGGALPVLTESAWPYPLSLGLLVLSISGAGLPPPAPGSSHSTCPGRLRGCVCSFSV